MYISTACCKTPVNNIEPKTKRILLFPFYRAILYVPYCVFYLNNRILEPIVSPIQNI